MRPELTVPARVAPDPSRLARMPDDERLPEELRDGQILATALGSVQRRRAEPAAPPPKRRGVLVPVRNIVLVSHCDYSGNSALHVVAIANELARRGLSPRVAVPENPESFAEAGPLPFAVVSYADAIAGAPGFPDGRGADVVYAFTPRELVREATVELVRRYGCLHLVHLEDNDLLVLAGELGAEDAAALAALPLPVLDRVVRLRQAHPLRARRLLELAAGVTVIVPRLGELVPPGVPAAVVGAGFDEALLHPSRSRDEVRAELGLAPGDLALAYTGTVHALTRDDVRQLYDAVRRLRRDGVPAVLVKTGAGADVTAEFPPLGAGLRDLGHLPRQAVSEVLEAADVLVQPGAPGPFNDYRFPAKLPEYLASGRPVVLPRANVGLRLRDGEEAILLERGDEAEIAAAVSRLAEDDGLRERIGRAGREFALRELRWESSVDRLEALLADVAAEGRGPASPRGLKGADPPVTLVGIVQELPDAGEKDEARRAGLMAFCVGAADVVPDADAVEVLHAQDGDYEDRLRHHLALPLPERPWYRVLAAPEDARDLGLYSVWLRKLVLQTAARAPLQRPLLFVDASPVWHSPGRAAFLSATHGGIRGGIRQFYAAQNVPVTAEEADAIIRSA
jgi:glycosyltransferase involved in cell wall biosynthesis